MKKLGIVVLVLLGIYGCWQIIRPSVTVRYRLTLTIDDNGKQTSGSGVIEVFREDTTKIFGSSFGGYGYSFRGEAVAVDLGKKGVLFALLKGGYSSDSEPPYIIIHAFKDYFKGSSTSAKVSVIDDMRKLKWDRPKADLNFDLLPMLVRFRDINDPKTVERVFPDELDKSFGPGVKLVSATIEITRDSVTRKIKKVLPSWKGTGYAEWKRSLHYGDPLSIDREDFERK